MHRNTKGEVIAELREELAAAPSLLVADPRGLTVAQLRELRGALRPHGATFRVSKNTLTRIAAREAGRESLVGLLSGPTAIAFCREDPAPVAKAMSDFAKASKALELRGAVLDDREIDASGVQRLATLPTRDQLLAQFVGGVAAPLSGLVNVLAAVPRGLVVALDQVRQQKEAAA
jgi:large subunit ribosomal protein L10